jgi:inner membrane protein
LIVVIFTEINFINPYLEREGLVYSMIFGFAMFSHFILDMATVSGIPLFYPLMKNPCVFPANAAYRFRTGNVKSEALIMCFFVIVIFSSVDLFSNGFWTSYNRGFGTIMHVNREFKRQSNLLEIAYIFNLNGIKREGKAYLLNATDDELELFENGNIWTLSSKDNRVRNIDLKPTPTTYKYGIRSKISIFIQNNN